MISVTTGNCFFAFTLLLYVYSLCVSGKGLIPNPEEEEYIRELNRALFDAVPESKERNVTDPNPIIRKFCISLYVRTNSYSVVH